MKGNATMFNLRNLRLKVTQNHRIRVKGLMHIISVISARLGHHSLAAGPLYSTAPQLCGLKQQVRRVHRRRCSSKLVVCTEAHQRFEGHFLLGDVLPMDAKMLLLTISFTSPHGIFFSGSGLHEQESFSF